MLCLLSHTFLQFPAQPKSRFTVPLHIKYTSISPGLKKLPMGPHSDLMENSLLLVVMKVKWSYLMLVPNHCWGYLRDTLGKKLKYSAVLWKVTNILHFSPVHRCKFTADGVHVVSFSDDKAVSLWDIPSETEIVKFSEHSVSYFFFSFSSILFINYFISKSGLCKSWMCFKHQLWFDSLWLFWSHLQIIRRKKSVRKHNYCRSRSSSRERSNVPWKFHIRLCR